MREACEIGNVMRCHPDPAASETPVVDVKRVPSPKTTNRMFSVVEPRFLMSTEIL